MPAAAPLSNPYGLNLADPNTPGGTNAPTTAPLPTDYPSAPSTTGTPQNRLQLAQTAFDTFANSTAPQYQADLRSATQQAAGNGQEGSGQIRTTYGNLANQRALALDTERQNLINSAITGTIADQQANRGLDIQQYGADTSRLGTVGSLQNQAGQLELAKGEAVGTVGGQQTLAARTADQQTAIQKAGLTGILDGSAPLQAKQDAVNQAVAQGQLTVQQGQLELARLTQATQASQTQQQIDLSKLSEADQTALAKAGLTGIMSDGSQTLQAKTDAINAALAQGQLTNAQAQTAIQAAAQQSQASLGQQQVDLAKLSQADQTALAKAGLTGIMQDGTQTLQAKQDAIQNALAQGQLTNAQAQTAINALAQQSQATTAAGQLQLARDQLTQAATQFGLSQQQQLQLANLANATQNRQIDVTSEQGKNALLVQLASIIGGPTGSLDPNFVQTIMNSLGIAQGTNTGPDTHTGAGQGYAGRTLPV